MYFNPVGIKKPEYIHLNSDELFSHNINIHTPENFSANLENTDIAIIGVDEFRNYYYNPEQNITNKVRAKLYQMRFVKSLRIHDLGNLKTSENIADTYSAIRDIIIDLLEKDIICIIIGGSQDISYSVFQAYKFINRKIELINIDYCIDAEKNIDKLHSSNFLRKIFENDKGGKYIKKLCNIAYQSYYTSNNSIDYTSLGNCLNYRLGDIRQDINLIEPDFRTANFVSFDMGAVRASDYPLGIKKSPNGLYGEEACSLSRFSGLGDNLNVFGLFQSPAKKDGAEISTTMSAQIIWYFLEGFSTRTKESIFDNNNIRKYIVKVSDIPGQEIVFYESLLTGRWWFEVPDISTGQSSIAPCNYSDYKQACNQDIPERWLFEYNLIN